jgi:hypothetical protein
MQDPSLRRSRRAGCAALIGQEAHQILKAAAEPINAPGHNHIELALCCVSGPDRYANAVGSGPDLRTKRRTPRRRSTGNAPRPAASPLGLDEPREPAINENRNAAALGELAHCPWRHRDLSPSVVESPSFGLGFERPTRQASLGRSAQQDWTTA